jgi:hypothetical protein
VSALWAGTIHHGVAQPLLAQLEVDPVAPATEDPQNVPASAAVERSLI